MHPELFTLPFGFTIQTYGFCLMVGFLSAVWLAMRRATRVKASSDVVLDLSLVALLFGVGGARLFYVIHYWQTQFADAPNALLAIIDIRKGGLEFLGGLLGASLGIILHLWRKRLPIRLYIDILTPGAMWGLAFGRLGCFFNGCCFGAVAVAPGTDQPQYPWAVRFPYGSPAMYWQWEHRQLTVPAELLATSPASLEAIPVPGPDLRLSVEQREGPRQTYLMLKDAVAKAEAMSPPPQELPELKKQAERAKNLAEEHERQLRFLFNAQRYPSRDAPGRGMSVTELQDLAAHVTALPVHPSQLYAAISAMLLSGVLSGIFYRRKRHGIVAASLFALYPLTRVVEEIIRADQPRDTVGLTVSQFVSLAMFVLGVLAIIVLRTRMPARADSAAA